MIKHILTKDQRLAGLDTQEDDHNLYIIDTDISNTGTPYVAILSSHAG
jgi:hypothetical protein